MTTYRLTVNGTPAEVDVPGMRRLLDVLREDLALTGTKEGCGEGECGACTVLVDGAPVDSCLVPVCQVAGRSPDRGGSGRPRVRPAEPAALDPLQVAFLQTGGAQCGICTPGMLMAARAYLDAGGGPDEDAIREAIAGNLCRCTGYTKIIDAISLAASGSSTTRMPGRTARHDARATPMASLRRAVEAYARIADAPRATDRRRHGPDGRPDR